VRLWVLNSFRNKIPADSADSAGRIRRVGNPPNPPNPPFAHPAMEIWIFEKRNVQFSSKGGEHDVKSEKSEKNEVERVGGTRTSGRIGNKFWDFFVY
jgi:hypothetical protein